MKNNPLELKDLIRNKRREMGLTQEQHCTTSIQTYIVKPLQYQNKGTKNTRLLRRAEVYLVELRGFELNLLSIDIAYIT